MLDDYQLLSRYARDGSEAAFGEIVSRHVNLVYSAALRRTAGDVHAARTLRNWSSPISPAKPARCRRTWSWLAGFTVRPVMPPRNCSEPNAAARRANTKPQK